MATQERTENLSFKSNADLSTKQYLFMKETAAKTVDVCAAITDKAVGVLQDSGGGAGRWASVATGGTTKVVASGVIAFGAYVAPTATGQAQVAVSTQFPRGQALEAAAVAGDIIEILLIDSGVPLP